MNRIDSCMDSHVHWLATGEFSQRLDLSSLAQPQDISKLQLHPHHFRGEWLFGFGWDQSQWPKGEFPSREILDAWQGERPVVLSRCDGHSYWVNTAVLKLAGLFSAGPEEIPGGRILRDGKGLPTGVLVDNGKAAVDKIIPSLTSFDVRRDLLKGVQILNEAGFTHIRDMTCKAQQWQEAVRLDETGLLTLAVEEYFWLENFSELSSIIDLCQSARAQQSKNLRAQGLKIFLDGSLGSESAHISCSYHGGGHGLILWQDTEVESVVRECAKHDLDLAVHAIGDAASQRFVGIAQKLKATGVETRLHLEHAEVLRPETVAAMKTLDLRCHLQPSHFLSDQKWLKEKLGEDLFKSAFPWRQLQEAGIQFDFGSDSPLAPASIRDTLQGLSESEKAGIPRLLGSPFTYMGHADTSWCPNTFSEFADSELKQVVFRGEHLM